MTDAARDRYNQGLNPESFAHRVFNHVKQTNDPGKGAKEYEKMDERRQQLVLAVAHEMSLCCASFRLILADAWLVLFRSGIYGGSDIVCGSTPEPPQISIVQRI